MCVSFSEDSVQRESGKNVQFGNIGAAKAVADVIRTCLGPKAMLKVGWICAARNGSIVYLMCFLLDYSKLVDYSTMHFSYSLAYLLA